MLPNRKAKRKKINKSNHKERKVRKFSCGKLVYASKSAANKANKKQFAEIKGRTIPYQCPKCNQWHLTTLKTEEQK